MYAIAPLSPAQDKAIVPEVVETPADETSPSIAGLVDLLLKDQPRLNTIARDADKQRDLLPRLLAVGLLGYAVFGVALALAFTVVGRWPELTPIATWLEQPTRSPIEFLPRTDVSPFSAWLNGDAAVLLASYTLGLIGALGICLPSFYFYGLLAGVRSSMVDVAVLAAKTVAAGAVALVGVLPIYVAVILGAAVFEASAEVVVALAYLGLILPFVAGLWGTRTLYVSFLGWCDTLPALRRERRKCFLRRLLLAWCGCYTAIAPVMIYTLWEKMA